MNIPTAPTVPATAQIPEPDPERPVVVLVISNPVFPKVLEKTMACPHCKGSIAMPVPAEPGEPEPVAWALGKLHPFVPTMQIKRMHLIEDVVHIYSASNDGNLVRDTIPMSSVRLLEQGMSFHVYASELEYDESYDADDLFDPETEPDPESQANGEVSTATSVS